jgi:hypothetical protein
MARKRHQKQAGTAGATKKSQERIQDGRRRFTILLPGAKNMKENQVLFSNVVPPKT